MGPDGVVFEKLLASLPVVTHLAGEPVLSAGLKTNLVLILKKGAVVVLKDSIEIARVGHLGAVLGELSALLEQPHMAEVRAWRTRSFMLRTRAYLRKIQAYFYMLQTERGFGTISFSNNVAAMAALSMRPRLARWRLQA
jgi:CRP-like cAMP-binding protein